MNIKSRFRADFEQITTTILNAAAADHGYNPELLKLVLVLEDKRFANHNGVDFIAAMRAFARWGVKCPRGGASTIDMQLVRTVTGYRAKTVTRKLYESALAIAIRRSTSAETVLLSYLNVAYFGIGVTGAEAAALAYFGQPTDTLSVSQSAELAAMLVYPLPKQINPHWVAKVKRRARYGLDRQNIVKVHLPLALRAT